MSLSSRLPLRSSVAMPTKVPSMSVSIHQNREKKGLKGTNKSSGLNSDDDHTNDRGFAINNGVHLSMDSIISGVVEKPQLDNPFTRFHEQLAEYP